MPEPLIVGVDPGSTSAVAAINLDGELKLLESDKELGRDKIIQKIIETGKPVVVACDTEKMPSTVDKIASSLGARRYEPEEDLSSQWKKTNGEGSNSHEKDAYASAFNAYRNLQREIRKIKSISSEEQKPENEVAELYFSREIQKLR